MRTQPAGRITHDRYGLPIVHDSKYPRKMISMLKLLLAYGSAAGLDTCFFDQL